MASSSTGGTASADGTSALTAESGSMQPLAKLFPFPLDPFQLDAIDALNQGQSVVVSAPTGSGKTLVGEYAIHRALAHGQKVLYTTPLKALSNQKLRDFRHQFGADRVGLLTGDLSLNREAQVVVMTTEIFRNMLYAEIDHPDDDPLAGVEAVVLDECHYMNDSQRGTVWEESIIHCPPRFSWWPSPPRWPTPASSPTGSRRCMAPPGWCSAISGRSP
jgi:superfamily II RNA helicase